MRLTQFFTIGSSRLDSNFAKMYASTSSHLKGVGWVRMILLLNKLSQ